MAGSAQLYSDVAVVLRTYKLGEADRIVVLLTAAHGKVRAVAKGVRKTSSKFGARMEPMSHVKVLLRAGKQPPGGGSILDTVSQAESIQPLAPLFGHLDKTSQALAVLEAADQLSLEREPNPQLYRMVVGALRAIAERDSPLIVPAFFWKALAAEGFGPEVAACVGCGETDESGGGTTALVAFDIVAGGAQCAACRTGTSISPMALALLRDILGGRLTAALGVPESRQTHEIGVLATRAVEHHVERRLRAIAMFER